MKFDFAERTYPGDVPRPAAEITVFENDHLCVITTPWGDQEASKLAVETLHEYFVAATLDPEATSPFAKLPGLSAHSNALRIGTLLANDTVFQRFNKDAYVSSCELTVIASKNNELKFIQLGQPHIMILRDGRMYPLQTSFDFSLDYRTPIPLPNKLLGIEPQLELETKSLIVHSDEKLVLLSRTVVPSSFFSKSFNDRDGIKLRDKLFDLAVHDNPAVPFWLALS